MTAPAELIQEAQGAIVGMIDHLDAVIQYSELMAILMTAPDMECPAGLHRLVLVVTDHARSISGRHAQALRAIHRLANP
jgi:hypothetical protein